jgi:drug/metabolite transporter (DMT)-like permease
MVLVTAVAAISLAAIFIKLAMQEAALEQRPEDKPGFGVFLSASRMGLAAILMFPLWLRARRKRDKDAPTPDSRARAFAVIAGVFLGLHFALWISSLAYTSVAASVTLVTTNPLWVAFFGWILFKTRPGRRTVLGILVAIAGGAYVGLGAGAGNDAGSNPLLGDALALTGSMAMSIYLLLGQQAQRRGYDTTTYSFTAYCVAALVLFPVPFLFGTGYTGHPTEVYVWILCLALVSQMVGHTGLNWSVRWVAPTTVALAILFEPIGSSVLDFAVFGSVPAATVWLGGSAIIAGVAIVVWGQRG